MAVFRTLPSFYPILDADLLERAGIPIEQCAHEWRESGIRFLQYRDKHAGDSEVLLRAARLRAIFPAADSCLILNDRAALVAAAGFDGLHLGQEDLPLPAARALAGAGALIGLSTHNRLQTAAGGDTDAGYLAIGPVFPTATKENPDPAIGLEGVAAARKIADRPLVAIGGITRANCAQVLRAGADSVAVISGLMPGAGETLRSVALEFLDRLHTSVPLCAPDSLR